MLGMIVNMALVVVGPTTENVMQVNRWSSLYAHVFQSEGVPKRLW